MMLRFTFRQVVHTFALFAITLCACRLIKTGTMAYVFLVWNLFLAFVPWWVSSYISKQNRISGKCIVLLLTWLLFLPNAPYLLTDLFHLRQRPGIPQWFDLALILSFASTGLLVFYRSLDQVLGFLMNFISRRKLLWFSYSVFFLIAFGVYLGRFIRLNSWDVIHPFSMMRACSRLFLNAHVAMDAAAFTIVFASLLLFLFLVVDRRLHERPLDDKT